MQNTKENQATIGNLIDSVIDDNTHDNCVQRQIEKLKQVVFSGGWISVDDKLPPNNTPVLIYLDDDVVVCNLGLQNNITIACYDNGLGDDLPCWLSVESQDCSSVVMPIIISPSEVAYWQPLPELPQKKTKRTLVLALLADNYPFVLVHKETYALRLCDETIIDELNLDDYFIDCKMTGQTIIDYVNGEIVTE